MFRGERLTIANANLKDITLSNVLQDNNKIEFFELNSVVIQKDTQRKAILDALSRQVNLNTLKIIDTNLFDN